MFRSSTILREFVQSLAKVTLLLKYSVKLCRCILVWRCGSMSWNNGVCSVVQTDTQSAQQTANIWYLSNRYCYLPLSRQVAVPVWQVPDAVDTVVCAPDDGLRYHPKHVEQFPDINKLCNGASCWIYIRIYLRCTDPWTLNKYRYIARYRYNKINKIIFSEIITKYLKNLI